MYAHKDIAFHFEMWLSPEFKIYLINEFQHLKDEENDRHKLEWNLQRTLAKINYHIHTDSIKENLIPEEISSNQSFFIYANEADILNVLYLVLQQKNGEKLILPRKEMLEIMLRLTNLSYCVISQKE